MENDLIERQSAIDAVDEALTRVFVEHRDIAEKMINKIPSAHPEQSSEIQDILDYLDTALHPIISPEHWNVYSELHDMISTLPSAQPEIIRCKDCKFYTPMNRETKTGICRLLMHQNFGDDWYCAGSERRTDDGE